MAKDGTRFSRSQVEPVVLHLTRLFEQFTEHYVIGGSWARGLKTVGDLDILLLRPESALWGNIPGTRKQDGDFRKMIMFPWKEFTIQLDLWITETWNNFGPLTQFVVGDQQYNIRLRALAIKKGYKLGSYLTQGGRWIPCPDESTLFSTLGMEVLPWSARSILKKE